MSARYKSWRECSTDTCCYDLYLVPMVPDGNVYDMAEEAGIHSYRDADSERRAHAHKASG